MFRGQNYENAFTLNILYLNISYISISGFGRNSDSDMRTFLNCDVKRFETHTGDIKTSQIKGVGFQVVFLFLVFTNG